MAITPPSPRKGDSLSAWILRANLVMQELLCFGVQGAIVPTKKYKKASIHVVFNSRVWASCFQLPEQVYSFRIYCQAYNENSFSSGCHI